jgi:hypothetical protein
LVSASLGCDQAKSSRTPEPDARSGTKRMADTLAAIYAQAVRSPEPNIFLNRERVAAIKARMTWQRGGQALNSRHWIAEELLRAGDTRESIAELESIMRDAKLTADSLTPQKKPLYELLALAYLRLGEQENCLDNPAATVCILPLKGAAQHTQQEGARGAIARYTELLNRFPEDHGSRWLLNIAYLAIGGYPDSVPKRYLIPNLAPRDRGAFPLFPNVAGDVGVAVTGRAGGLSIEDFNRDGLLDVFTTAWGPNESPHLFLADGNGGYVDATAKSGLDGIAGGLNTVHADYDNDGDIDILVLRGSWLGEDGKYPKSLLRNRGDGSFDDVTFESGVVSFHPSQTAAWADFNLDGYLDLFIGNERQSATTPSHASELYVNNRNGTFTDVAKQVGIDLDDFVKGVVWGDVNNDGLPDLYASVIYGRNRLYMNRGGTALGNWRFEERAAAAGVEFPLMSFPTWFWDFDQDGWEDLLVLSYDVNSALHETIAREFLGLPLKAVQNGNTVDVEQSRLYRNKGDGTFEDVTQRVGLDRKAIYAMGSNFGDLDNDGWLDFFVGTGNPDLRSVIPKRMFRNVAGQRFEEVTIPGGFGHIQKGHATAFADIDRDGDQDVYMVLGGAYQGDVSTSVLFENPGWPGRAWIALELEGRSANRSAIGAKVEVDVVDARGATRTVRRSVNTGGSFGAGSLRLHIGLGRASRISELRIQWPDSARSKTSHGALAMNRSYGVRQGETPVELERPATPFRKASHKHPD